MLRAAAGACADVLTGRSSRAARRLLAADRSRRCEESLHAWLNGGAREAVVESRRGAERIATRVADLAD